MWRLSIFICTILITYTQGQCPERNGRFADPRQCDKYLECEDGEASEKLCPDGLVFNDKAKFFSYPCTYPTDVDCTGREALQPAQPTGDCPHQFGYFPLGDSANCGQFINCADGRGYVFDCPDGLAFNPAILKCDWADQVETCDAEAFLGFTCPQEQVGPLGPAGFGFGRTFRSPNNDCDKYFICLEGRPRRFQCGGGRAFSEETGGCEEEDSVPGCANRSGNQLK